MSLNCAKRHDHKFDPFSQRDYYALAGIFNSSKVIGDKNPQIDGAPLSARAGLKIMTLGEAKVIADANLLYRGEKDQRGPVVPRGFPQVLAGDDQRPLGEQTKASGRLELAEWIVSKENPLTARVLANRVWQRLLGRGLVGTPNDFGLQGEPPSHPELLDYLASRLLQSGWSLKALIREIAGSRVFQLSSAGLPRAAEFVGPQPSPNRSNAKCSICSAKSIAGAPRNTRPRMCSTRGSRRRSLPFACKWPPPRRWT